MQVHECLYAEDLLKQRVRLAHEILKVCALCQNFIIKSFDLSIGVDQIVIHQKFNDSIGNTHVGFSLEYRCEYRLTLIALLKNWESKLQK